MMHRPPSCTSWRPVRDQGPPASVIVAYPFVAKLFFWRHNTSIGIMELVPERSAASALPPLLGRLLGALIGSRVIISARAMDQRSTSGLRTGQEAGQSDYVAKDPMRLALRAPRMDTSLAKGVATFSNYFRENDLAWRHWLGGE